MLSARYLKLHQVLGLGTMWLKRGAKLVSLNAEPVTTESPVECKSRMPETLAKVESAPGSKANIKPESETTPIKISSLSLPELVKDVAGCTACSLHQSRRQAIFGQGNPSANLIIIAESPNQIDDRSGHLFQSDTGNLLSNMLRAININIEDIYITTWVKCCPSVTLEASEEAKATCQAYLNAQIQAIRPKAILGLGANLRTLCTVNEYGLNYQNIPMVVTHHPERLLRHPQEKAQSYQALLKLKHYLQKA